MSLHLSCGQGKRKASDRYAKRSASDYRSFPSVSFRFEWYGSVRCETCSLGEGQAERKAARTISCMNLNRDSVFVGATLGPSPSTRPLDATGYNRSHELRRSSVCPPIPVLDSVENVALQVHRVFIDQRLEPRIFAQRIPDGIDLEHWDREAARDDQQMIEGGEMLHPIHQSRHRSGPAPYPAAMM